MKAILRYYRLSSKKMNLIARIVCKMPVTEAIDFLKFTPKAGARKLKETIMSAAANAENNFKQKRSDLVIKSIMVTEAPTLKRYNPISRGRTHPILKRACHVVVEVGVGANEVSSKSKDDDSKKIEKVAKESTAKKEISTNKNDDKSST